MKSRIEIKKRNEISKERLKKLKVKTTKDKYYKLSYEITIDILNKIINENKDEKELYIELDDLKSKAIKLQESGEINKILKNNLKMRVYNWVLNNQNNVEIEWVPLKYK
ncbi:hypothetical protein [Methanobrevibacter wolinii]|uniref:hypothetical protein n=1 Tax=Methanobrevibacter wolinii TaxID=190977 RepID=UPI0005B2D965|nr:hypothetical protein [Methanobrevibacter wolinii]MDD5960092.1 hypothetical protein [Methanobrevibacter wolinii]